MFRIEIKDEFVGKHRPSIKAQLGSDGVFWVLLAVYGCARVLQVYPGKMPMFAVVALHVFPPAIFTLLHGAKVYRIRGILTFVAITVIIGMLMETLGVLTGFPFGHYFFTDLMGLKVGVVPVTLGLAYIGMAYLSWTLARIIKATTRNPLRGAHLIAVPALATCIMVSWDLSQDPVWSTVLHAWIWKQGGAYFGVPLTNFFGWFLTVYLIYAVFGLYLRKAAITPVQLPNGYWRQAVIFYGVSTVGNLLLLLPQSRFSVVSDPTGRTWSVNAITRVCSIMTLLTMGVFTVIAWRRILPSKKLAS